jgi:hypothetical protein
MRRKSRRIPKEFRVLRLESGSDRRQIVFRPGYADCAWWDRRRLTLQEFCVCWFRFRSCWFRFRSCWFRFRSGEFRYRRCKFRFRSGEFRYRRCKFRFRASGDRGFHREGGREGCCRSDELPRLGDEAKWGRGFARAPFTAPRRNGVHSNGAGRNQLQASNYLKYGNKRHKPVIDSAENVFSQNHDYGLFGQWTERQTRASPAFNIAQNTQGSWIRLLRAEFWFGDPIFAVQLRKLISETPDVLEQVENAITKWFTVFLVCLEYQHWSICPLQ